MLFFTIRRSGSPFQHGVPLPPVGQDQLDLFIKIRPVVFVPDVSQLMHHHIITYILRAEHQQAPAKRRPARFLEEEYSICYTTLLLIDKEVPGADGAPGKVFNQGGSLLNSGSI